jgi:hypothetical protein
MTKSLISMVSKKGTSQKEEKTADYRTDKNLRI